MTAGTDALVDKQECEAIGVHINTYSNLDGLIRLQLSVYRSSNGIQAIMKNNARKLAEQDEAALMASGVPYTIIRAGTLQNTPGGKQGFIFEEVP